MRAAGWQLYLPPRDLPRGTLPCLVIFILASLHCSIGGQYASGTSRNDGEGGGYTVTDVKHDFVGGIIGAAGTLVSQLDDTRDIQLTIS